MKLTKRANYLLIFGFLVILNVLFRFPVTPHELGLDSFVIHGMANFISENGYAKWIMHPLSFFGLYPHSYPSGGIFYLSSVSQSTGIDTEYSILVVSTFLGVLGAFTTYLMAKEILDDDFFAFATAFIFSTSRVFLEYTTWTYTTRGFFMVLLPLFIWSLLRFSSSEQGKLKYIILAGVLLIILGTIHHIALFIPLVLVAYFIAIFINSIKHKFVSPFSKKVIPLFFFAIFTALFLMQFTGFTIYSPSYHEFQRGYFFQGSESHIILLNMGISYAMSIGILIILIPIGLVSLVFKSNKKLPEIFLLVLLLCFTPFLMDSKYITAFLAPVLSLFIGLGLIAIPKAISKVKFKRAEKVTIPILMIILLFSAFLPSFVVVQEQAPRPGYTLHMSERTYNAGLFMKDYGNGSTIGPGFLSGKIKATSGDLTFEDPDKYDFSTVKREPLSAIISKKMDTFYVIQDCYFKHRSYYRGLHGYGFRDCDNTFTKKILSGDNIRYVITNNYYPTKGAFFVSVQKKKYKVYEDGLESIWYLGR